jgi:hypothetical protein
VRGGEDFRSRLSRVRGPSLDQMSCLSVEGLSPRWTESVGWGLRLCQRGLSFCHDDFACSGGRAPTTGTGGGGVGDRYLRAFLSLARGCPWLGPVMPGPNGASS